MPKLPKKSDLERLSKEELIKEVLRTQRRCEETTRNLNKHLLAYSKLEISFDMLKTLYDRQKKSIGIDLQTNAYLMDLCEMAIMQLGARFIIGGLRSVNNTQTLCQLHRSEN